jgi:hypothetical protein
MLAGIESEYPMSSGTEGVLYGGARRVVRSQAAMPAGAGDEVDGEPGDRVPQRQHRVGGEPLPGPAAGAGRGPGSAACDTPRVVTIVRACIVAMVAAAGPAGVRAVEGDAGRGQRDGDDLVDHPQVGVPGHHPMPFT